MRKTRVKRKLLARRVLDWIDNRLRIGVPLSRAIRDADLDLTRPTVNKLVQYYAQVKEHPEKFEMIEASLFPDWLDDNSVDVQENPENWVYLGCFPWGEWQYDEDN